MDNNDYTIAKPATQNSSIEACIEHLENVPSVIHGSLFGSLCIMAALSFLTKRKFYRLDVCNGRPGLIYPLNLIDEYEHRWSYAFAFGAITNIIVVMLFFGISANPFDLPTWASVLASLIAAFEVCVVFLPLFACIKIENRMIGALIGLIVAGVWFTLILLSTIDCANPWPELVGGLGVILQLPTLLCLGFLVVKFLILTIQGFNSYQRSTGDPKPLMIASPIQIAHVKGLLSTKPSEDYFSQLPSGTLQWHQQAKLTVLQFVDKHLYKLNAKFMYSSKMVCTIFVVFMVSYQLFFYMYFGNEALFHTLESKIEDFLRDNGIELNDTTIADAQQTIKVFHVTWNLFIWIVACIFAIDILAILGRYRKHILLLYKGDKSFYHASYKPSNTIKMWSSMMFPGYQIAYKLWSWLVMLFLLWIVVVTGTFLITLPLAFGNPELPLTLLVIFVVPYIFTVAIRLIQKALTHFYFLQDKLEVGDKDKPLALTNRRLFHLTNYFFFLANISIGIFSCLYRMGTSFVLGLFFLGRMDKCVLIRGFEQFDKGHMAYLGMLHVDVTHNHPALRVFCQYLLETTRGLFNNPPDPIQSLPPPIPNSLPSTVNGGGDVNTAVQQLDSMTNGHRRGQVPRTASFKRARNRWCLAYTLSFNPDLRSLRRNALGQQRTDQHNIMVILSKNRMIAKLRDKLKAMGKWRQSWENNLENIVDEHVDDIIDKLVSSMEEQEGNSDHSNRRGQASKPSVSSEEIDLSTVSGQHAIGFDSVIYEDFTGTNNIN